MTSSAQRPRQVLAAVVLAACVGLVGGALAAWAIYARFGPVERVITQVTNVGGGGSSGQTVGSVAGTAEASVVEIATKPIVPSDLLDGTSGMVDGFVVSSDGLVVTTVHAVRGATRLSIATSDGRVYQATVVRADPQHGLVVLRAVGASGLQPLSFAAQDAKPGDEAIAVAHAPFSPLTLSIGTVSSTGVSLQLTDGEPQLSDILTVDATPDPREDGAPLLSGGGDVIGVVVDASGVSPGVVAIAGSDAGALLQNVSGNGAAGQATFGANSQLLDPATAVAAGLPAGALIRSVTAGGPAATAGLQPGDVVTAVDGTAIDASHPFEPVALGLTPDQQVTVTFWRAGATQTASLVVGSTVPAGQ
ncbi:MAG: trypsin-like peptidase domain-containing protein [Candidatus Dormibacteraeota bacterium]|nr:trypsin-like peptidase domain-containing protein [Candidatus Dormibacteraeota bacterium]